MDDLEQLLSQCQSIISQQLSSEEREMVQPLFSSLYSSVIDQNNKRNDFLLREEEKLREAHSVQLQQQVSNVLLTEKWNYVFHLPELIHQIICFLSHSDRMQLCTLNRSVHHQVRYCAKHVTTLGLNTYDFGNNFLLDPISLDNITTMIGVPATDVIHEIQEWIRPVDYSDIGDQLDEESDYPQFPSLESVDIGLYRRRCQFLLACGVPWLLPKLFNTVFIESIRKKNIFARDASIVAPQVREDIKQIVAVLPRGLEEPISKSCINLESVSVVNQHSLSWFPHVKSASIMNWTDIEHDKIYPTAMPIMNELIHLTVMKEASFSTDELKDIFMNCPNLIEFNMVSYDFDVPDEDMNIDEEDFSLLGSKLQTLSLPYSHPFFTQFKNQLKHLHVLRQYRDDDTEIIETIIANNQHTLRSLSLSLEDLDQVNILPENLVSLNVLNCCSHTQCFKIIRLLHKQCKNLKHLHFNSNLNELHEKVRVGWKLPIFENLISLAVIIMEIDFGCFPNLQYLSLIGSKAVYSIASKTIEFLDLSGCSIFNLTIDCPRLRVFKPPKNLLTIDWKRSGMSTLDFNKNNSLYVFNTNAYQMINGLSLTSSLPSVDVTRFHNLKDLRINVQSLIDRECSLSQIPLDRLTLICDQPSPTNLPFSALHRILHENMSLRTLILKGINVVEADQSLSLTAPTTLVLSSSSVEGLHDYFPNVNDLTMTERSTLLDTAQSQKQIKRFRLVCDQINGWSSYLSRGANFPRINQFDSLECLEFNMFGSRSEDQLFHSFSDDEFSDDEEDHLMHQYMKPEKVSISHPTLRHLIMNETSYLSEDSNLPNLVSVIVEYFSSHRTLYQFQNLLARNCSKLEYIDLGELKRWMFRKPALIDSDSESASESDSDEDEDYDDYESDEDEDELADDSRLHGDTGEENENSDGPSDTVLELFVAAVTANNPNLKLVKCIHHSALGHSELLRVYNNLSIKYPSILFCFQIGAESPSTV